MLESVHVLQFRNERSERSTLIITSLCFVLMFEQTSIPSYDNYIDKVSHTFVSFTT